MAVVQLTRPRTFRPFATSAEWLVDHRELAVVFGLVAVSAVAHAWNMFGFPYYEDDEGTYLAQAWSTFHLGQLAPYTYWYDHPPVGWIQLGLLASLVNGGFTALGDSVGMGRVFMLLYHVGSTVLVYRIARGSGRSVLAASVAVLAFSLSAYGLYFQRRVLLDNIAAFWILAGLVPLFGRRVTLARVWISAAALGIGLLSKEIDVVIIPAMAVLVVIRVDRTQRWLAGVGWTAVVATMGSLWILLAVLKGELLPPGGFLSGAGDHVSLVGTLSAQAARDADGGLFQAGSGFWQRAIGWAQADPLLVIGGTVASIAAALRIRRDPSQGLLALMAISIWVFLGRGGATLPFYLVPLLPLLALQIGWLVDVIRSLFRANQAGVRIQPVGRWGFRACLVSVVALSALVGYRNQWLGFRDAPTALWTSRPAAAQRDAIAWVRDTLPAESGIAIDMYAWLDLQAPATGPRFELAHYYWKVDQDPEIRDGVFGNDWRRFDYLMMTPQGFGDAKALPLLQAAIDHSDLVTSFGDGDWPVLIERTRAPQAVSIENDTVLMRQWREWKATFLDRGAVVAGPENGPTADLEAMGLLQAVYMGDRQTFDSMWDWTKRNLLTSTGLLGVGGAIAGAGSQADAAMALLFAARRWNDESYTSDGVALTNEIWARETRVVGNDRLVVADVGPLNRTGNLTVDLSGLAPNAYRIFAAADPRHDWAAVIDGTYRYLQRVASSADLGGQAGVVPHWALVDPKSGAAAPIDAASDEANLFDADASRLTWRVGLDWLWNRDPRARAELVALAMPRRELAQKSWLGRAYHLDGNPIDGSNTVATYTTALPSVLFGGAPELAASTFTKDVLAPVVGSDQTDPEDAIGRSWAWFGTALMDGSLVDLTRTAALVDWSTVPGLNSPAK